MSNINLHANKLTCKQTYNKWQGPALGAHSCSINKLENFRRTENREQTDREFNYRGHSYPLWIVGVSGPIYNKGCILKPIYFRINNCSDTVFLPPVSTLSPSFYPLSFPISVSLISRSVLLDPMETVSVRLVWVTLEFLKYVTVLFI